MNSALLQSKVLNLISYIPINETIWEVYTRAYKYYDFAAVAANLTL